MRLLNPKHFVIFALTGLTGVALLHVSQNVQRGEEQLEALRTSIAREEEHIRMLNAEWVHLNRPERLEKLAEDFLNLGPVPSARMIRAQDAVFPEVTAAPVEGIVSEASNIQPEPEKIKPKAQRQAVSFSPPVPMLKPRARAKPFVAAKPRIQNAPADPVPVRNFSDLLNDLAEPQGGNAP